MYLIWAINKYRRQVCNNLLLRSVAVLPEKRLFGLARSACLKKIQYLFSLQTDKHMHTCVYTYIHRERERNAQTHFLFIYTYVFASTVRIPPPPLSPPNLALQNTKIEAQEYRPMATGSEGFPLSFSFKEPFHAI